MTARLSDADVIAYGHRWNDRIGICECMYCPELGQHTAYGRISQREYAAHVTAALREARAVRTVEELEALPEGAVVKEKAGMAGVVYEKLNSRRWVRMGWAEDSATNRDIHLPAALLWAPADEGDE